MKTIAGATAKVLQRFNFAKQVGGILSSTTGDGVQGRHIEVDHKPLLSFASCSYLGLDQDPRLIHGSMEATRRYGTTFSTSRTYLQMGLYDEIEDLYTEMFGAPSLLAASTTLAHQSVMPALMTPKDALILDYQAHNSLQDTSLMMKGRGCYVEKVAHNDAIELRERISKLCSLYPAVWYVADGVYSIYGDTAPFELIRELMDEFDNLYLYIDDAHGMGWEGKHGRGKALAELGHHERQVLVTSMNKAGASGGGAIVLPNEELRDLIRITGKTLTFSGPLVPGQLGAARAAASIFLSSEIDELQAALKYRCQAFADAAKAYQLSIVDDAISPIFYVGIGGLDVLLEVNAALRENHGFFITATGYPAVPFNKNGIRITLTALHEVADIERLAEAISTELNKALNKRGESLEEIQERFAGGVAGAMM